VISENTVGMGLDSVVMCGERHEGETAHPDGVACGVSVQSRFTHLSCVPEKNFRKIPVKNFR